MALAASTRLGPYEIIEAVDQGGMGWVFRARDVSGTGRIVALKLVPSELKDRAD